MKEFIYMNIGTGIDLIFRDLAEAVAAVTKYQSQIHLDFIKSDGTLTKQSEMSCLAAKGWRDLISLEDGLASTVTLFEKILPVIWLTCNWLLMLFKSLF